MNIIRKPSDADRPRQPKNDPYRFGWRDVPRIDECGREHFDMVPLTEEDILHPELEDHVTQNMPHQVDCAYLFGTFQIALSGRAGALVVADHKVIWDIAGMGSHGPDIAVVFGVQPERVRPESFDVAEHGVRPELIIEVTSPATRRNDLRVKPAEYWQCGVQYYVIVEEVPRHRQRQLRIIGYRRGKRGYRQMRLNARGWLWLETVQLWLGQENGRVVCYDKQRKPIVDRVQAEQERQQAEQRAEQEAQLRAEAEQRAAQALTEVARLQEELRRLRGV
jgi:colicin import membrane protein